MKTRKHLTLSGAALLMVASIGSAYADDNEITQTQSHDRIRTQMNLQTPTSDFGQSLNREQTMVMNKNQNQYQYKYMNNAPTERSGTGEGSMTRYNTMNRTMQNSAISGSMNRQSTANRSMGGGRR